MSAELQAQIRLLTRFAQPQMLSHGFRLPSRNDG